MRAIVLAKHGPPEQALELREWPDPVPGDGQVLIEVRASGLNFADIAARVGLYPDAPKTPSVTIRCVTSRNVVLAPVAMSTAHKMPIWSTT